MRPSPEAAIRGRIASHGPITFAEFMALALYHPAGGYYTDSSPIGASGDYFTSPIAHPAFGALIAVQLRRMWELLGSPPIFGVVEAGAGTGRLARDIIGYAPIVSESFARSLRYMALDRYAVVPPGGPRPYLQQVVASTVPLRGVVGCFISNELVDSLPVHRFRIVDGEIMEMLVGLDCHGRLIEVQGPPSTPALGRRLESLGLTLPEGFRGEVNLEARRWLAGVADSLERGFVLTIDYGCEARELYSALHAGGTLRTYRNHLPTDSPLDRVGEQDITAHVDFSLLSTEGRLLGLETVSLRTQERFLRDQGFDRMMTALRGSGLPQGQRDANAMAMLQLVDPQGLGRFKVLVQEKGAGVRGPEELLDQEGRKTDLDVPLLQPGHISLLEGRYPHSTWAPEALWPWHDSEEAG